ADAEVDCALLLRSCESSLLVSGRARTRGDPAYRLWVRCASRDGASASPALGTWPYAAVADSSPAATISRRSHSGDMSKPFGQVGAPNSRNARAKKAGSRRGSI